MKIEKITYHKVFNLGNYQNEKIGVEISLSEDDDPVQCHSEAVKYVEKAHSFKSQLNDYMRAQEIVSDPKGHTGYQVENAKAGIEKFEAEYEDYIKAYKPQFKEISAKYAAQEEDDLPY